MPHNAPNPRLLTSMSLTQAEYDEWTEYAKANGISRAELIRRAVKAYIHQDHTTWLEGYTCPRDEP